MGQLIENMPFEEYLAHPAMDQSALKMVGISPKHFKACHGDTHDTAALVFGRAFHAAVLEPEVFHKTYVVAPDVDRRTKEGKDIYAAFVQALAGKTIITHEDMTLLRKMAESVRTHIPSSYLLGGNGKNEVSLFWTDEATGIECKMRVDRLREDGFLIDLKTTETAHPDSVRSSAWKYFYHMQTAFYWDGYAAVLGKDPEGFGFIFAEKRKPFDVYAALAHKFFIQKGRELYRKLLDTYANCKTLDEWPGYAEEEVGILEPPAHVKI